MADRQWLIDACQIYEEGEEEYFVDGVQFNEDQAAVTPVANNPWYYYAQQEAAA